MGLIKVDYKKSFFSEEEKRKKIFECIDKLIVVFPEFDYFHLHEFFKKIESDFDERKKIDSIASDIRIVLQKLDLIENPPFGNAVFVLTAKGRAAKNKGGYFKYLNSLEPKTDWLKIIPIILTIIFGLISSVFLYLNYDLNIKNKNYKTENNYLKKENNSLKKEIIALNKKK